MKYLFFDFCAVPLFVLILWMCYSRGFSKGRANRVFITMNLLSLACVMLDVVIEVLVYPMPLSRGAVIAGTAATYAYLVLRNSTLVFCLIYVFEVTRTDYRIRSRAKRMLLWLPNGVIVGVLVLNLFNHRVFTVTVEEGYARGPAMMVIYGVAALYGVAGAAYCIYCKRYLAVSKWIALISVYALTFVAVVIQLLKPRYLVELFSTALGLLAVMLLVLRPEESMDASVGILSWKAYLNDLRNIILSGQHVQILVIQMPNADEIRSYVGESDFNAYISEVAEGIERSFDGVRTHFSLYFERPGGFYVILEDTEADAAGLIDALLENVKRRVKPYEDRGVRFDARFCVINCPEDLGKPKEIVRLGHRFTKLGRQDQMVFIASEMVGSRDYSVTNNMEEILNRVITEHTLEMYYQPIYDLHEQRFRSAEALARVLDPEYGMISPAAFIPAAESAGLILPIGDIILESVFRFISEHDLEAMGMSFIEINLSVAQCLQAELPATVRRLQEKYGIQPKQVNFEVTETMFDNLSSVMDKNLRQLSEMGYSFSLDDYGVGYSNIRRLRSLPLDIIKIDKSLVDDMFTEDGEVILENTVHMMKGIHKALVVEGVESLKAIKVCNDLSCDYIQGFYYSKPLPAEEFVEFIKSHNQESVARD